MPNLGSSVEPNLWPMHINDFCILEQPYAAYYSMKSKHDFYATPSCGPWTFLTMLIVHGPTREELLVYTYKLKYHWLHMSFSEYQIPIA